MTLPRRRVLCVRPRPRVGTAEMMREIEQEWVHALALHCDVTVIEQDFDLHEIVDTLAPDFMIFDGIHLPRPTRLRIANIDQFPHIPRALLLHHDPHDSLRPVSFEMLRDYGIDTVFEYGIEQRQYTPELSRPELPWIECFSVPLAIDADRFCERDLERIIPISIFSGNLEPSFYPWRAAITSEIPFIFPTLIYTHPGYYAGGSDPFAVHGEQYARLLGQSRFSIADTTRFDYAVRKHLEIPASGAVLIAPNSAALRDYGFVDGQNCLLGEGRELYLRIGDVARDPAVYEAIRRRGYNLVHSRYTSRHWTQIPRWYEARRVRRPGEHTEQIGLFGDFRNVPAQGATGAPPLRDHQMTLVLRQGRDAILSDGDLVSAKRALQDSTTWLDHIAEPWFLLGVIALLEGEWQQALMCIGRRFTRWAEESAELAVPEPVEVAWLMLLARLSGNDALRALTEPFATRYRHLALRRMSWLLDQLSGRSIDDSVPDDLRHPMPDDNLSIHWLGQEDFEIWLGLMGRVLNKVQVPITA